jgi:sulfofructose kinase
VFAMTVKAPASPDETFDLGFPAGREFDVVGLGQNAVDHFVLLPRFPVPCSKLEIIGRRRLSGGQVATAMAFTARLGLRSKYVGKVGSDEDGQYCLKCLRCEDIDTSSVIVAAESRNHHSLILLDRSSGERTILWERDERLNYRDGELVREDVCAGKLLLLDQSDPEASLRAARWARDEGIPVMADLDHALPGSMNLVPLIDFLVVSENFPAEFTGESGTAAALLAMRRSCRGFLAATLGSKGAIAVVGDRCAAFPACEVEAVDTTGAGDAFHGAVIYGLFRNWPLKQIMSFANAAAGLACTRLGAREGLPSLAEIERTLSTRI